MLRKFKITYVEEKTTREPPKHHEVEIKASSKYDAKSKFYHKHPDAEIIKVEVTDEQRKAD